MSRNHRQFARHETWLCGIRYSYVVMSFWRFLNSMMCRSFMSVLNVAQGIHSRNCRVCVDSPVNLVYVILYSFCLPSILSLSLSLHSFTLSFIRTFCCCLRFVGVRINGLSILHRRRVLLCAWSYCSCCPFLFIAYGSAQKYKSDSAVGRFVFVFV